MVSEALLSFSLTPVQSFIEAARTVRDLKAGSRLLSHLTWQALQAVGQAGGQPMFPAVVLNGDEPESIPNLFLARFQGDDAAQQAAQAAEQAEKAVRERWRRIADKVHGKLASERHWRQAWERACKGARDRDCHDAWNEDWKEQIESFWTITAVVLDAADAKAVYQQMTGGDPPKTSDLSTQFKAISGLLAARKMVRRFVADHGVGRHKCSIMGDLEQMGPVGLQEANTFWQNAVGTTIAPARIGRHDRLCAVSLVKRFCHCAPGLTGLSGDIPETAEVAARRWYRATAQPQRGAFESAYQDLEAALKNAGKSAETRWRCLLVDRLTPDTVVEEGWEGQALPEEVEKAVDKLANARKALMDSADSSPPRYYGIIALDGDHMGKWLSGDKTCGKVSEDFWKHISNELRSYAGCVPCIVEKHGGYCIYAGGDDVLALLPLETALECAKQLRDAFPQFPSDRNRTTASAGLAIVHYLYDLRAGLRAARKAEHDAKDAGRNALGISLVKRSGAPIELVIKWDQVPHLMKLQALFAAGLSDRWLYKLAETLPDVHEDLAGEALRAIVAHSLKRIEIAREKAPGLRQELGLSNDADTDAIKQALRDHVLEKFADWQGHCEKVAALDRFIKFGMIASFLHRGRD